MRTINRIDLSDFTNFSTEDYQVMVKALLNVCESDLDDLFCTHGEDIKKLVFLLQTKQQDFEAQND